MNALAVANKVPAADRQVTTKDNIVVRATTLTDEQKAAIAKVQDSLVESLGKIVSPELDAIIVRIEEARKDAAAGPFALLKWFKMNVEDATLVQFPTPGSDVGDNPDKYQEPYYSDGKRKFRATSFYLKFFLQSFPAGRKIAAALQHIVIAKDEKANQANVPEYIRQMNPVALEAYREDLVKQQNTGVRAIRDCIALSKQLDAVNNLAEVRAEPIMDENGDVAKIAKPIKVWNTKFPDSQWALYSISGFMQFDPDKASELGGTYDALRLTAKRERAEDEDNGNGGGDKPQVINTNATMVARINDMAEYIANKLMPEGHRNREAYALFLKEHINGPDSGDLIYNLSEIKFFVDGILNIPAVQTKLEQVSARRNET